MKTRSITIVFDLPHPIEGLMAILAGLAVGIAAAAVALLLGLA